MLRVSQTKLSDCDEGREKETCLHKHLGTTIALSGSAVDRHGLPVTGEFQGDVLLHELLDHLLENTEIIAIL